MISITMKVFPLTVPPTRSALLILVQVPPADKELHQPATEKASLCRAENTNTSGQKKKGETIGGTKNLISYTRYTSDLY